MKRMQKFIIGLATVVVLTVGFGSAQAFEVQSYDYFDQVTASYNWMLHEPVKEVDYFANIVNSYDTLLSEHEDDYFFYVRSSYTRLVGAPVSGMVPERSMTVLAMAGWEDMVTFQELLAIAMTDAAKIKTDM